MTLFTYPQEREWVFGDTLSVQINQQTAETAIALKTGIVSRSWGQLNLSLSD